MNNPWTLVAIIVIFIVCLSDDRFDLFKKINILIKKIVKKERGGLS